MLLIIRTKIDSESLKRVAEDLLETNKMDYDSMINLRPSQNTSREILDQKIRERVERITRSFLQPA